MPKLPVVSGADAVKAFQRAGGGLTASAGATSSCFRPDTWPVFLFPNTANSRLAPCAL